MDTIDTIDTIINKNLKEALTQVRGRYYDGCDISLEIPAFLIKPGSENYRAFGLDLLNDQFESKLEFVHIVHPQEIEKNHIRLHRGERTGEFDLTAEDFKDQIKDFGDY